MKPSLPAPPLTTSARLLQPKACTTFLKLFCEPQICAVLGAHLFANPARHSVPIQNQNQSSSRIPLVRGLDLNLRPSGSGRLFYERPICAVLGANRLANPARHSVRIQQHNQSSSRVPLLKKLVAGAGFEP